jgi:hypothetical protein
MREKGPTKIKIKAIDPQKNFAPQNILIVPRACESLNPGLVSPEGLQVFLQVPVFALQGKIRVWKKKALINISNSLKQLYLKINHCVESGVFRRGTN